MHLMVQGKTCLSRVFKESLEAEDGSDEVGRRNIRLIKKKYYLL